jgi:hypothetical protein
MDNCLNTQTHSYQATSNNLPSAFAVGAMVPGHDPRRIASGSVWVLHTRFSGVGILGHLKSLIGGAGVEALTSYRQIGCKSSAEEVHEEDNGNAEDSHHLDYKYDCNLPALLPIVSYWRRSLLALALAVKYCHYI